MRQGSLTNKATTACLALSLIAAPCAFICFGSPASSDQHTERDATNEGWSWFLYIGGDYDGPKSQPESPRQLLKRLGPRLDHGAAMDALVSRMKSMTIPPLNFKDAPAGAVFDQINRLIQTHNEQGKAFWIPTLALRKVPRDFDMDKPESSPTDFTPLSPTHISLTLPEGSLWDAITYVSQLANLWIVPESNAVWLVFPSVGGGQILLGRRYLVPKSIILNSMQAEAILRQLGLLGSYTLNTWAFDSESGVFTVTMGYDLDTFELWYARELLKHGYSIPPWQPEGAVSPLYRVPARQTDHLDPLTREATAVMDLACAPNSPGWRREKGERLRQLVRSLCHIDTWIQAHPKLPYAAMAPPSAPEGLPQGSDPSAVKDPVKRKAFADADAKAVVAGYAIEDREDSEFLYENEWNYTLLFVGQFFNASEKDEVKAIIYDNTKNQSLRAKVRIDFDTVVKQVETPTY